MTALPVPHALVLVSYLTLSGRWVRGAPTNHRGNPAGHAGTDTIWLGRPCGGGGGGGGGGERGSRTAPGGLPRGKELEFAYNKDPVTCSEIAQNGRPKMSKIKFAADPEVVSVLCECVWDGRL